MEHGLGLSTRVLVRHEWESRPQAAATVEQEKKRSLYPAIVAHRSLNRKYGNMGR
jgi:hypothetical protein